MRIWTQKSASIQKRTNPLKFDNFAEKSEKDTVSYLSTKAGSARGKPGGGALDIHTLGQVLVSKSESPESRGESGQSGQSAPIAGLAGQEAPDSGVAMEIHTVGNVPPFLLRGEV